MTTREKLIKMLVDNGMFESQAKKVLEIAIPKIEEATSNHDFTWDRPAEEYPESLYEIMWICVKATAKDWLAENAPQAWFRPMFD
ncbi:MAG: hypothetical protein WAW11_02805 [Patescibacteria group bacterium]